ncbi:MAG: anthranilate synthase component I [Alphaproteobacteria bacterium]|nr:anthranilate synthase component I [Alphaproteobacteria bacterium]
MATLPPPDDFAANFGANRTQLVWEWVPADLETPVSAYLKLSQNEPYSFLYESVEGGKVLGRYSAIGFAPDLIWKSDAHDDPLASLHREMEACKIDVVDPSIPPMGPSGLFGYMGYDCIRFVEDIPDTNPDTLEIPESIMIRPSVMVIFDNVKSMMCLVTPVREHSENSSKSAEETLTAAQKRITSTKEKLQKPFAQQTFESKLSKPLSITSHTSEGSYKTKVERAKEYILSGDIFQVVLSQRFETKFDLPPFELYRSLRRLNPSPFLFFMKFDDFSLIGSSPEILVRLRDNKVTIRPIAGTRKRGKDANEDKQLAEELLADPKERAEHLMLLDLGRNDIGRVAKEGSVRLTEEFVIEYYSHVMHIVSNVEGKLAEDKTPLEALFSGFPAGTVSGAPKIRAMEIIDELEELKRSFYGGCVGYLDGHGNIDTCIALRTGMIKDGTLTIQAGAGIVADSDPASEHQECLNKARAIIQAAEESIKKP